jgi:hypothetical protein
MIGSRVHVQDRDRRLFEALEQLVIVDREQAQVLAPFTSVPRANARLLALTRAGLLHRSFIPAGDFGRKAVYRLPKASGRRLIEARIAHQLALNRVFLWLKSQTSGRMLWRPCTTSVGGLQLIPDAYAELPNASETMPVFIEADCGTEPLSVWKTKAERYVALASSGAFKAEFGRERFRVLVFAPTTRRARTISQAVSSVTNKLFWLTSFESINHVAASAAIWMRPGTDQLVPLPPLCATVDHAAASVLANPGSARPVAKATT